MQNNDDEKNTNNPNNNTTNNNNANKEKEEPLFEKGELLYFQDKACRVIAEYDRTVCVEYSDYPFAGEEEEFPYPRVILLKNEVRRPS
ncbi:hypothetical protein [Bacillus piscicola]|uniref:hypothetical protein n=1 Tax=Bacillus piscicola TaxID=1632684 RepID=UPI001F096683|nr:hypothetical protein [Bacillus piscicola]